MSPNQSTGSVLNEEDHPPSTDSSKDEAQLLTTDCPSYADVMHSRGNAIGPGATFLHTPKEENDGGSEVSTPSQKITIESLKGHSDEDDFYMDDDEDDRSSVVSESSLSDSDHREGVFHERLKLSADKLAVDAINCASDELQQCNKNNVICVKSELGAQPPARSRTSVNSNSGSSTNTSVVATNGGLNNGYVVSEVDRRTSRNTNEKRKAKELVLRDVNSGGGQVVPVQTTATAMAPQTTAIFNDSTDITLGNKTFITGSLTIKQYIKDCKSCKHFFAAFHWGKKKEEEAVIKI